MQVPQPTLTTHLQPPQPPQPPPTSSVDMHAVSISFTLPLRTSHELLLTNCIDWTGHQHRFRQRQLRPRQVRLRREVRPGPTIFCECVD